MGSCAFVGWHQFYFSPSVFSFVLLSWPSCPGAPQSAAKPFLRNSNYCPPHSPSFSQVRLPRTFRRFCGLMVQLLQKLSIRATNGPDKLLKVVKGPVTRLFPPDAERVGFSHSAPNLEPMQEYVKQLPDDRPVVFVVGAFAHGKIDNSYCDTFISISQFPLSAAYALSRITNALENKWGIV